MSTTLWRDSQGERLWLSAGAPHLPSLPRLCYPGAFSVGFRAFARRSGCVAPPIQLRCNYPNHEVKPKPCGGDGGAVAVGPHSQARSTSRSHVKSPRKDRGAPSRRLPNPAMYGTNPYKRCLLRSEGWPGERKRRSSLLVVQHPQENMGRNDGNAGKGIQGQQVLISTDDDVSLAGHGQL